MKTNKTLNSERFCFKANEFGKVSDQIPQLLNKLIHCKNENSLSGKN